MDPAKVREFAGRLSKGGKGAGPGLGLLGAAAALSYGLYKAMYTGIKKEWQGIWYHSLVQSKICETTWNPF